MAESIPTLAQVVGSNVRKLRGDHTLDDVAAYGRTFGATWSSGSISSIERGNFKVTIETLVLLAFALDRVRGNETMGDGLTIRDFLETEGLIDIGVKNIRANTSDLMEFLSGKPSVHVMNKEHTFNQIYEQTSKWLQSMETMNLPSDLASFHWRVQDAAPESRTEVRLAEKIGIRPYELRSWSMELWGMRFEDRRDEIAGKDATPQKKGRVSRELLSEIAQAMEKNSNGDS